jgi:hypothetical protein
MGECVQANVHKDALVESVVVLYPRVCDFGPPQSRFRLPAMINPSLLHLKHAASELVFGKEVMLQRFRKDKCGRTIADVLLPDGTNVNHSLVEQGWCWWYRKYAPADTVLEGLETEAREARTGLWADP